MMKELITSKFSTVQDADVEEGDYYEDDILYCGKCRTAKQVKHFLSGKTIRGRCLCKCQAELRDKAAAEAEKAEAATRIRTMRAVAFPDTAILKCRFELDDLKNADVSRRCRNYVLNFNLMKDKHKGLLLYGPVGTGKTFMGAAIANALVDKGVPCLVTDFARLTNELFGLKEEKQEYIDSLNDFALLVIDDFASERDTDFMLEQVYNIVDSRYRSGKPLIITTNLTGNELKKPSDLRKERIYSRILEICFPVEVPGVDRRKVKVTETYNDICKLLDS